MRSRIAGGAKVADLTVGTLVAVGTVHFASVVGVVNANSAEPVIARRQARIVEGRGRLDGHVGRVSRRIAGGVRAARGGKQPIFYQCVKIDRLHRTDGCVVGAE